MKEYFMEKALLQALKCLKSGDVPVGCVIVKDGKIIAQGRNRREKSKNAVLHAEIDAIIKACRKLGGWYLKGCEMYVTLEPCPMCAGAIIQSRIERVYIGALDPKGGAVVSVQQMFSLPYNHKPQIEYGILNEKCSELLKDFFRELRKRKEEKN